MIRTYNNYTLEELISSGITVGENVTVSSDVIFHNPENITIGDNTRIDSQCLINAGSNNKIIIGKNVHISAGCYYYGGGGDIIIEDFAGTSSRVTIFTSIDDFVEGYMTNPMVDIKYRKVSSGDVILRCHTIVGSSSIVLPGVNLAKGTSVGAMSLVKESTQEYDLITGIPAKFKKKRKNKYLT